ncbi:MAG TPA: trehalose-phosphatase, partial [Elusimicrobiota bacterium]|nr:trehalose-phosphatase [Elusimicrobiota bacterium]
MTKSFWGFAHRWVGRVRAAPRVLLALDFDGTLAPLVDHPSRARMPATLRKRLGALTDRCDVAVLSGRSLADVRKRVGVGKVFYGGNHGLEMSGPGFGYVNPTARRLKRHTGEMMRLAQEALRGVAGGHLEEKG